MPAPRQVGAGLHETAHGGLGLIQPRPVLQAHVREEDQVDELRTLVSGAQPDRQRLVGQQARLLEPALQQGHRGPRQGEPPLPQRLSQLRHHDAERLQLGVELDSPAQRPERLQPPGVSPRRVFMVSGLARETDRALADRQPLQHVPAVDQLGVARLHGQKPGVGVTGRLGHPQGAQAQVALTAFGERVRRDDELSQRLRLAHLVGAAQHGQRLPAQHMDRGRHRRVGDAPQHGRGIRDDRSPPVARPRSAAAWHDRHASSTAPERNSHRASSSSSSGR
ncbi:hypothetical protein ACFQX6_36790 [Streptosporangium lutulentum]